MNTMVCNEVLCGLEYILSLISECSLVDLLHSRLGGRPLCRLCKPLQRFCFALIQEEHCRALRLRVRCAQFA
jgi:hypothetical protein